MLCDKERTGNPAPGGSTHTAANTLQWPNYSLRSRVESSAGCSGVTDQPHQAFHSSPLSASQGTAVQHGWALTQAPWGPACPAQSGIIAHGYCLPPNKMGMMRRSPCFLCSVKVCGGSRFHFWRSIEHFPEQCCMRAEYLNGEVRRWVKCAEMCGEKRSGWQAGTICHEQLHGQLILFRAEPTLPIWTAHHLQSGQERPQDLNSDQLLIQCILVFISTYRQSNCLESTVYL